MKKALAHTRVTVKLRKSEYHDEWYLYIEAYPVFQSGKDKPLRLREYPDFVIVSPKNLRQRVLLFSDVLPSAWFAYKLPCSEVT